MIRILALCGRQEAHRTRCIATRRGVVESLAIIGDMLTGSDVDGAWMKLRGYLDGYFADPEEGVQIVINHSDKSARPTDVVEVRMMGAVERYTLTELRDCFHADSSRTRRSKQIDE